MSCHLSLIKINQIKFLLMTIKLEKSRGHLVAISLSLIVKNNWYIFLCLLLIRFKYYLYRLLDLFFHISKNIGLTNLTDNN